MTTINQINNTNSSSSVRGHVIWGGSKRPGHVIWGGSKNRPGHVVWGGAK